MRPCAWLWRLVNLPLGLRRRLARQAMLRDLAAMGHNFVFDALDSFVPSRMYVGDNVFIGQGARVSCPRTSSIHLRDGVTIGPGLTIMGGDHTFNVVGKRVRDVTDPGPAGDIVLEEDVWCGANVTILKGVTIGQGSIVGAGSVVCRSLPPYTICVGNPCRPRKLRFTDEQLREHLGLLGRSTDETDQLVSRRREATKALEAAVPKPRRDDCGGG